MGIIGDMGSSMTVILTHAFLVLLVLLHVWFFILEALLWEKPLGRKIFKLEPNFAKQSAALAANQGLYNLFLAAGLFWSFIAPSAIAALHLQIFFLGCIAIAGIFGALTVHFRIFLIQGLPALVTLLLLYLHH
jgi:putative membrane protein